MLLLDLLTILSLGCGSLASSPSAQGKWKKSSSASVHQAGCTTEFLADKIHYYNSASRVRAKLCFDRQMFFKSLHLPEFQGLLFNFKQQKSYRAL
jgi:hypothetical protein